MPHALRAIPPLNDLLARRALRGLQRRLRRDVVVALLREALDREREFLRAGKGLEARYGAAQPDRARLVRYIEREVLAAAEALVAPKLRTVINATGVLLHTNLGRARLADAVVDEMARVAGEPVPLEIDLETGDRGQRADRVVRWLRLLTGAEDAVVVNNGAAALWFAVHALARRRRAIISRGEMVAIGGSFRMPELMATSGARIVEVGTTNRTAVRDYARELREGDVIVKVHPSNYRVEGFTEEADLEELAKLCTERGARLVFDAGSGSLYDFGGFGLHGEDPVSRNLRTGAHLVTFSGDKLLGGPQAGILVGKRETVTRLARHPMMRALRCDKLILSALEATLRLYAQGRERELPLLAALSLPQATVRKRAVGVCDAVEAPSGWTLRPRRSGATPGGGSYAMREVRSWEVEVAGPQVQSLADRLRQGDPAVLTRVAGDAVRLDMRGLAEDEIEPLVHRLQQELADLAPKEEA